MGGGQDGRNPSPPAPEPASPGGFHTSDPAPARSPPRTVTFADEPQVSFYGGGDEAGNPPPAEPPAAGGGDGRKPPPRGFGELTSDTFKWRDCLGFTGPGFLMAIAYIDPGNFESDLAAGAQFRYSLLWVLLVATLGGWLIQVLTVMLASATGLHLAEACYHEYPRRVRLVLWVVGELAIVASDIPEVIGTAFALKMLSGGLIEVWVGVVVTGLSVMVFLLIQNLGARALEAFFGAIVAVISLCYVAELAYCKADVGEVLTGLFSIGWFEAPVFSEVDEATGHQVDGSAYIAVSLLGALVMPHNLFLHSALVLERPLPPTVPGTRLALLYNTLESGFALAVSLFINIAVVITACAAVSRPGVTHEERMAFIEEPLQHAPEMLTVLGKAARPLFGVALLASGQSSTMTGTLAGQYVMEGFIKINLNPALRAFITRCVAIVPSLAVTLIAGEKGSEDLIKLCSVILSIQLPFALIPLVKLVASREVMGELAARGWVRRGAIGCSVAVVAANVFLMSGMLFGGLDGSPAGVLAGLAAALFLLGYLAAMGYIAWKKVTFKLSAVNGARWAQISGGPPPPKPSGGQVEVDAGAEPPGRGGSERGGRGEGDGVPLFPDGGGR